MEPTGGEVEANEMALQQIEILAILAVAMGLFVWGKWRADVVALLTLAATVVLGLVPAADAFLGFGHPAVITVAAVQKIIARTANKKITAIAKPA